MILCIGRGRSFGEQGDGAESWVRERSWFYGGLENGEGKWEFLIDLERKIKGSWLRRKVRMRK